MCHAVVIGGTKGIGAGIASFLRSKAWNVSVTGVGDGEVAAYSAQHPDTPCAKLDVRNADDVTAYFAGLDRLDGLVNCAGILLRGTEYEIETFEKVIDINLTGTMR